MDKWLNHPTALKIISVILGLFVWVIVHIELETPGQTTATSIDTKTIEASVIVADGLDEDKYLLSAMEPTVVRLDVQGRLTDLKRASSDEDYVVMVDLKDAKPGIQELPLKVKKMPKGITLVQMSPNIVTVQIEEIVTQSFDLQVTKTGEPAAGYHAAAPTVVAASSKVEVTLPKDDMGRVGSVAATVNIDGADKTVVNKKAKIIVFDTDGIEMDNAIVSPETAQVEVKVTPPFKSLPLQLGYSGKLPDHLSLVSVKPAVETVTVYGEQQTLDELQVYDGAVLDLSKVKQSGSVQVATPAVNGLKSVEPVEVAVEVVVAPIVTRTFSGLPIHIEGVSTGSNAVISTPAEGKYTLTVSGAATVLSKLQSSDIRLSVNLEGLAAGEHTVPLVVDVPEYVDIVLEDGEKLTATVKLTVDETAGSGNDEDAEEVSATPTTEPGGATDAPDDPDSDPGSGSGNSNTNTPPS